MAKLNGTAYVDLLRGTASADTVHAGAGNDFVFGGDGDDVLYGGADNDLLNGGAGADRLYGGQGADNLYGGAGNDTLLLGSLADAQGDFIDGGSDIDTLVADFTGLTVGVTITAADPDAIQQVRNVVFTGIEAFNLTTGAGNDILTGGAEGDRLNAGAGDDKVVGASGNDVLQGGLGNDRLYGGDGADSISGGDGNDLLVAGKGADQLFSGNGNDRLVLERGPEGVVIDGGAGIDTLDLRLASSGAPQSINLMTLRYDSGIENAVIATGAGADSVSSFSANNTIAVGAGNDEVHVQAYDFAPVFVPGPWTNAIASALVGVSTLTLGAGDDTARVEMALSGIGDKITIDGGSGLDSVRINVETWSRGVHVSLEAPDPASGIVLRNVEQVTISTGSGADTLTGGALNDWLSAGTGHDLVEGKGGDDLIQIGNGGRADGGEGDDRVSVDLSGGNAAARFTFSSGTVQVNSQTSFANMESIEFNGGSGNDTVTGSSRADRFSDGAGNDVMHGGAGDDVFVRGTVNGAAGTDHLDGGDGVDVLSFAIERVADLLNFSSTVVWRAPAVLDLLDQSQNAGAAAGLTVSGIEVINGTGLNDVIRGSAADEVFSGSGGNDFLDGRAGADDLTGGAGNDTFHFGADSIGPTQPGAPADHIRDFASGMDKLEFDAVAYGHSLSEAADPHASGSAKQLLFNTTTHELWFDVDGAGAGAAQLLVTLDGVASLGASDFLFV